MHVVLYTFTCRHLPHFYHKSGYHQSKWLCEKFQNEGQHTITGSCTPPNEPEALIFHMITWSETSKVLAPAAQEAFKMDFAKYGQSLTPPQMLH